MKFGNGLFQVANAGSRVEKAIEGLKFGLQEAFKGDGAKVAVGNAADTVSKTLILIEITK